MTLLELTSCDDIRASLGVDVDELADATISLPLYENGLLGDLEDLGDEINLDLITSIDAVNAKAPSAQTDDEKRLQRAARNFATYSVARQLGQSLPMFGPKDITDGKAGVSRFAQDPYRDVVKGVTAEYNAWRQRLAKAAAVVASTTVQEMALPTLFLASSPSSDPVTGT